MWHARSGGALAALSGTRVAAQSAPLASQALRGEGWDQALPSGREAGERAMAQAAHRAAGGYVEPALSALQHLPATRATRERALDLQLALRTAL